MSSLYIRTGQVMDRQLYDKLKGLGVELPMALIAAEPSVETEIAETYLEELTGFLVSFDFMKLGQAVSKGQWEAAMMALRRMEQKAKRLGIRCFDQPFSSLRQAILGRNVQQGKQIMAAVTAKRVRLRETIKKYTDGGIIHSESGAQHITDRS